MLGIRFQLFFLLSTLVGLGVQGRAAAQGESGDESTNQSGSTATGIPSPGEPLVQPDVSDAAGNPAPGSGSSPDGTPPSSDATRAETSDYDDPRFEPVPPRPDLRRDAEGRPREAGEPSELPVRVSLHGYYRARIGVWDALPIPTPGAAEGLFAPHADATNLALGFQRLRLEPSVSLGEQRSRPIVTLHSQFDILDNVVFGDNARAAGTPLFAMDPSVTTLNSNGTWSSDIQPIILRRVWLELAVPFGQIRIGRQPSHGGMGLLFNDGNGFRNDFGDAWVGSTFDRVAFITQPLTVINALSGQGNAPTPLIVFVGYDWLVEDQITLGRAASGAEERRYLAAARSARSPIPFAELASRAGDDDVWQTTIAVYWLDSGFNQTVNDRDELNAGLVLIHRGQENTLSNLYIADLYFRTKWSAFGHQAPLLYTELELYTIQGRSYGVALTLDYCNPDGKSDPLGCDGTDGYVVPYGQTETPTDFDIWSGVLRFGAEAPLWSATLEGGFSTGQRGSILGPNLTLSQRPMNPDYRVGLLLYPVVLNVLTAASYNAISQSLWSQGAVWNSVYLLPQIRYRPFGYDGNFEVITQFLVVFADQLSAAPPAGYPVTFPYRPRADGSTGCGFVADCLAGWELDVAIKLSWGPNEEMKWSNEFGLMGVGDALGASRTATGASDDARLSADLLWTLQTRIAFVF